MVNRGRFCLIHDGETIAKFTRREDGGTLRSALAKVEKEYLKDAKVRLYNVETSHVDDFLECMQTRKKPITHESIGGHSVICCHLMNLAYWHDQTIQWDPAQYTFRNGSGDIKWLTGIRRDYKAMA